MSLSQAAAKCSLCLIVSAPPSWTATGAPHAPAGRIIARFGQREAGPDLDRGQALGQAGHDVQHHGILREQSVETRPAAPRPRPAPDWPPDESSVWSSAVSWAATRIGRSRLILRQCSSAMLRMIIARTAARGTPSGRRRDPFRRRRMGFVQDVGPFEAWKAAGSQPGDGLGGGGDPVSASAAISRAMASSSLAALVSSASMVCTGAPASNASLWVYARGGGASRTGGTIMNQSRILAGDVASRFLAFAGHRLLLEPLTAWWSIRYVQAGHRDGVRGRPELEARGTVDRRCSVRLYRRRPFDADSNYQDPQGTVFDPRTMR